MKADFYSLSRQRQIQLKKKKKTGIEKNKKRIIKE